MEWIELPRSTRAGYANYVLDVWRTAGSGWRFTILDRETGRYEGKGEGYETRQRAQEVAEQWARQTRQWNF